MRKFSLAVLLALFGFVFPAFADGHNVVADTRTFLDAYARGDSATVLNMVDKDAVTVYGSDVAERFHGQDGVRQLMADDQKLWGGAAKIGAMDHVNVVETRDMASVMFDAPFSVAGRPPVTVRFAMVWKRRGNHWLLVQSSNAVPSEGQSAAELLKKFSAQ